MAVTIQQIADKMGVSRGTVDRALNHRGRIKEELAAKIRRTAREMGYVHRPRKRASCSKNRIRIGIVTRLSGVSFMSEIRRGLMTVKQELEQEGIDLIISHRMSSGEKEQMEAILELEKAGISGLAIMPAESDMVREKIRCLTDKKNMPVVTFNSDIVGTKRAAFVGMDNFRSGQTAAGLFRMMTAGEGNILIVTGRFASTLNSLRVEGFVDEMKKIAPRVQIAGVQCSFDNAKEMESIIENGIKNISGLNGIFIVSGGQEGIEGGFAKAGITNMNDRPFVVVYDRTEENIRLLKNDRIDFLLDQNGYEQGYRPPRILADIITGRMKHLPDVIYTETDIKTKYNID